MQHGGELLSVNGSIHTIENKLCFLGPASEGDEILRSWKLNPVRFFSPPSKIQSHFFMTAEVVVSLTYFMGACQGRQEDECGS